MSTLGGAHGKYFFYPPPYLFMSQIVLFNLALGIGDKIGNFEIGKDFDALVINLAQTDGNLELWLNESIENRLSKWIHLGDDRSISRVYVHGVEVKEGASNVLRVKRLGGKRKSTEIN